MVHRSSHGSRSRRSSSIGRRCSISSAESLILNEENSSEMFSGAASEIIPSSITSFHYPHHFGRSRMSSMVSAEASPLLHTAHSSENIDGADQTGLYMINSNERSSMEGSNFKFFSPDEIETAPGGSTLDNPEDPVDYNTNWDYSIDKYEDDAVGSVVGFDTYTHGAGADGAGADGAGTGATHSLARHNDSGVTRLLDMDNNSYGSINSNSSQFDKRKNRRYSEQSNNHSVDTHSTYSAKSEMDESYFPSSSVYQRYYLAEEDLVIGIAGYQTKWWKKLIYYTICIVTCGLGYLLFRWIPKYRVNLLGNKCPLGYADWVVIENEFGELSIIDVERRKLGERMSCFLVVNKKDDAGYANDEDLDKLEDYDPFVSHIHTFTYRYLSFFYSPMEDMFRTNSNWYDTDWLNVKRIGDGLSQKIYNQRLSIFGENSIAIEDKSILQLLIDEVLHPFYVFQVFSVLLWLADDYFYYASCIFIISIVSIVNSLVETKSTVGRLKQISKFNCEIRVWRNNFWKQIDSSELVCGDVFEVDPSLSVIPCDAILINGECIINESMLTGESVPVSKTAATQESVENLPENFMSPLLAKSFLYNGTKLLKMKSSNDEPVTAMVVKTGFNTTKGSLVRSMLFPKPVGFKFYQDSFKYIGFMSLIALIGFTYSTYNFIKIGIDKRIMILRALDIITIVVPPALPATLTIGTTFAINRLKAKNIFCISPTRVNVGGKIDVFCFDKTGTLTEDGLDILGVHVANNAKGRKEIIFDDMLNQLNQLTTSQVDKYSTNNKKHLLECMATCHSLKLIENELLGDPLDLKMFEFTNWHLQEDFETEFGNVTHVYPNAGEKGFYYIKEYEFISGLRRMSVVVQDSCNPIQSIIYTKGAPEVISEICIPESLPQNYEELLHEYTHNGYRVIACAYKKTTTQYIRSNPDREIVENDLIFAGFIIFENKLKQTTRQTLETLNNARIRTVMCTGDNILTAISVAKECKLLTADEVYVPRYEQDSNETNLIWEEVDDSTKKLDSISLKPIIIDHRESYKTYKLAITGDVFRYLLTEVKNPRIIQNILMNCDVFARMSPDEKHELVEKLQSIDYTVGFCGDGANDCGALKAADVGISLSEAEASVAAPFTSRIFEISCVLDVIKEGRSSLVTSFSCFKYMSLYSAIQFVTVTILYKTGTNLGDFQFLYIDMCLILPLAIFMSWSKPFAEIVIKRPTANLVSPKVLIPMCCHILVILIFQVFMWGIVHDQPWYIKPVPGGDDAVQSSDNTMLFLFTNFQYILIAIVLSTGPPYREPMSANVPFIFNVIISCLLSSACFFIDQDSWWGDFMQLTNMPARWYCYIVIAAGFNLAVMYSGEKTFFPIIARAYKRMTKRNAKSSKLFKNLKMEYEVAQV